MIVLVDNIPEELKALAQWVVWRWVERNGKRTKPLFNPHDGYAASSTNPTTWGTFDEALAWSSAHPEFGVGFVFTAGDPFAGIDLDHCRDADTGEIASWARAIIGRLKSYTEVSPSGTGVKIIVRGQLPRCGKRGNIEMYDNLRYFTLTGQRLEIDGL